MRRVIGWVAVVMVAGCMQDESMPDAGRSAQADTSLAPVVAAAPVAPAPAAAVVDESEAPLPVAEAAPEVVRPSIRLADAGRAVERESARAAVSGIDGVRSATWLDRENLLVKVDGGDARGYTTIDTICAELEPKGDTQDVVVNLQSGSVASGGGLEVLSRKCQLAADDQALLQQRGDDGMSTSELRAQQRKGNVAAEDDAVRREAEAKESMRVLEANTPEMGHIERD